MPPAERLGRGWEHRHGWVYFNFLLEEGWAAHNHAHCDKDICKEGGESFSGSAIRKAQREHGFLAREGAGLQEEIFVGKAEQHRMTALAGGNPQGPNPPRLCSHWLSWPAAPSGSQGLWRDYPPGQIVISVKLMDTKADSASERHPSSHQYTHAWLGGCWAFQQSLFRCLFAFCAHFFSILYFIPM